MSTQFVPFDSQMKIGLSSPKGLPYHVPRPQLKKFRLLFISILIETGSDLGTPVPGTKSVRLSESRSGLFHNYLRMTYVNFYLWGPVVGIRESRISRLFRPSEKLGNLSFRVTLVLSLRIFVVFPTDTYNPSHSRETKCTTEICRF